MRKFTMGLVGLFVLLGVIGFAAPKDSTYTGEIMDSSCAKLGSHKAMMQKEGTKDAKDCTLACVKAGGTYVLYNTATKKTYQLDDRTKPQQFAGDKASVTGTLDKATATIHVTGITPAS